MARGFDPRKLEREMRAAQRKAEAQVKREAAKVERNVQREVDRVNRENKRRAEAHNRKVEREHKRAIDDYNRKVDAHNRKARAQNQRVIDDLNRQLRAASTGPRYTPDEEVLADRLLRSLPDRSERECDSFLSYARLDGAVGGQLRDYLEELGASVWFDEVSIEPGKSQALQMDKGLQEGACRNRPAHPRLYCWKVLDRARAWCAAWEGDADSGAPQRHLR